MKWHWAAGLYLSAILHTALAQDIRSCVGADGSVVYTDKSCVDGELERIQPQAVQPATAGKNYMALPPGCDRTPADLLYGVRTAIDSQDVNQLAKHYHWPGVSDAQAENILNRLQALVLRPLVDAQLLYQVPIEPSYIEPSDSLDGTSEAENTLQASTPGSPYALKVLQYRTNNGSEIQSSQFKLQRYFECWWIRY